MIELAPLPMSTVSSMLVKLVKGGEKNFVCALARANVLPHPSVCNTRPLIAHI